MSTKVRPATYFQDLARATHVADPHATLETLRDAETVKLRSGEYVLTSYSDVRDVLASKAFGKPSLPPVPLRSVRTLFRMFLMLNAPDHPRLRRVVAPLFTPTAVAVRRETLRTLATDLIAHRDPIELISEVAYPLPLTLICGLLGVDDATRNQLAQWGRTLTAALDAPMPMPPRAIPRFLGAVAARQVRPVATLRAARAITSYARSRITSDDNIDGADMLQVLRDAVASEAMSVDEAVATWVLIVIAGHETTANLIGNTVRLLLDQPGVLGRVRVDRGLVGNAIDEGLRLEGPVPLAVRVATESVEIGGRTYERGATVFLVLSAANRDPFAFRSPNAFDLDRGTATPHLAFGHGSHFCIGAQLARSEAEAAIDALLDAGLTHAKGSADWRASFATRGLSTLVLTRDV